MLQIQQTLHFSFSSQYHQTHTYQLSCLETQIHAQLLGHDLFKYVDGTFPSPPANITIDGITTANPEALTWFRQDRLVFGALVGTLSQELVPLVTHTTTTHEAWTIL